MKNKKLGVIGGLGPKATAYFYNLVVDCTVAHKDQDHIDAIYLNHASMPNRTTSILSGDDKELKKLLIKDAILLEKLGASHIAIPCNNSHYFWKDIQDSVSIPVINMIKEVINRVKLINGGGRVNKVGVLATDGTVKTDIYGLECRKNNIEVIYPSKKYQKKIMEIIYSGVKGGEGADIADLKDIIGELKSKRCDAVILGCTELSVLYGNTLDPYIIDALYSLARRSIELSGKKVKAY